MHPATLDRTYSQLDEANEAANVALDAMKTALDRDAAVRALTADNLTERFGGQQ